LNRYLEGRTTLEQFGNSLAKEWASLPVVAGKKKGRSFYAGDGLNKSLTGVDDALKAIESLVGEDAAVSGAEGNDEVIGFKGGDRLSDNVEVREGTPEDTARIKKRIARGLARETYNKLRQRARTKEGKAAIDLHEKAGEELTGIFDVGGIPKTLPPEERKKLLDEASKATRLLRPRTK
jgi:hypothetical protein